MWFFSNLFRNFEWWFIHRKVEFEGDKTINYLYKTYFNNFKNVNNEKEDKIKVNTNYKKTPFTRDKTAKVINYELIAETPLR